MASSYRLELNKWLNNLEVSSPSVLDIGGSQEQVKNRVKSWDVNEYVIADLATPHKDSPKPDLELDLNAWPNKPDEFKNHFDTIFCLEVFDYVWSTLGAFKYISYLLSPNGVAWVTFPSVYPLHQPVEDDALRYMPGAIRKLAHASGLAVSEIIYRRPETNKWQEFFYAERMRGARNTDHSFTGMIVKFKKD